MKKYIVLFLVGLVLVGMGSVLIAAEWLNLEVVEKPVQLTSESKMLNVRPNQEIDISLSYLVEKVDIKFDPSLSENEVRLDFSYDKDRVAGVATYQDSNEISVWPQVNSLFGVDFVKMATKELKKQRLMVFRDDARVVKLSVSVNPVNENLVTFSY